VVTLDRGLTEVLVACFALAILAGNLVLARRHHR
jgi:hypothetical protein